MGVSSTLDAEAPRIRTPDGFAALSEFLGTVPLLTRFRDGVDTSGYAPVPDTWLIGTADVVGSSQAIELGGYKTVNMIGAGVIAAAMNQIGTREFPFIFGGDGATFVIPPQWATSATYALAAMRRWTTDETDLRLRAALVPVSSARAAGQDVRLARYAPSSNIAYSMFSGGGLAWAEQEMKAGRYDVPRAAEGVRPDLEGLSCRWQPAGTTRGEIISLIVVPGPAVSASDPAPFEALAGAVLQCINESNGNDGHPLTRRNIRFAMRSRGYDLESRTHPHRSSLWWRRLKLRGFALFAWTLFQFNLSVGAFDPKLYREDLQANSDFRKFDDGLKLTIDCVPDTIEKLETLLADAARDGIGVYGMHRPKSALITCIVPSSIERDHIHFVDGADGGYAQAAIKLKTQLRDAQPPAFEGQDRRQQAD